MKIVSDFRLFALYCNFSIVCYKNITLILYVDCIKKKRLLVVGMLIKYVSK